MGSFHDVFISYGRADSKQFATVLHDRLTALGYRVWFDQNDIPFAVDYQVHIDRSIETAHTVLFLISPHSVNSPYCGLEIEQALRYHKRIIPVMHVEAIDHALWQQRNPEGTAADWATYQAEGRHSGMTNLHPAVAKLNWINLREGIDDFDQGLQQITHTLDDRKDHVHQHTRYLSAALSWERHQRRRPDLLSGEVGRQAYHWLQQVYAHPLPFCRPTPLHSEFITASRRYADNDLTHVGLCYAAARPVPSRSQASQPALDAILQLLATPDEPPDSAPGNAPDPAPIATQPPPASASLSTADHDLIALLRYGLMEAGMTVWDRYHDLAPDETIAAALPGATERADSLVVLVSPATLVDPDCQRQLEYALQLNKRVVPVQLADVDPATVPAVLQSMTWLDLRPDADRESSVDNGMQQLVGRLVQDAPYHRAHTRLLVQALKWKRQRRNPSVLLVGQPRQSAQAWLAVANQRQQYGPTFLQQKFVAASLAQPPAQTLDVFVLCHPHDLDAGRRLNETLQLQSKSTWFETVGDDPDGTTAADRQQALANSENCVVVRSPIAVQDDGWQAQLHQAQALNKRVVAVDFAAPAAPYADDLATLPQVDFTQQGGDFAANFGTLYRILESDPEHVAQHTRLLVRATEWEAAERDDGALLRGSALKRALAWLAAAAGKTPEPTDLQRQYITASQGLPRRRIRLRTLGFCTTVATLAVLGLRVVGQLQVAELVAYDFLLRHRPSEPADDRLLIVTVDDASGSWLREQMKYGNYEPGIGTIPDQALREALTQLADHHPAMVGLDFYRDFAAEPLLAEQLETTYNLVGLCKGSFNGVGVEKPPEIPLQRLGFNDYVTESPPPLFRSHTGFGEILQSGSTLLRRHYLKQGADERCPAEDAFSLVIARQYLAQQHKTYTDPWATDWVQDMALGGVRVPQLWAGGLLVSESSAYAPMLPEQLGGYQTMLNFRATQGDINQFAARLSFQDLVMGQFDPSLVEGRIVLIGYDDITDRSADYYDTTYGEIPGVVSQGQMVSQLISASLDGRPLIWWWPAWADMVWTTAWAMVAGWVVWRLGEVLRMVAGLGLCSLAVTVVCYGVLVTMGGWLPLVPPLLAMSWTVGLVALFTYRTRHL